VALAFSVQAIAVSGTNVEVLEKELRGIGPVRLTIANTGANALTACSVRHRSRIGASTVAVLDSTTFATLSNGATNQIRIDGPVEILRIVASCPDGTTLDVDVNTSVD
jgi:hypothetical protein